MRAQAGLRVRVKGIVQGVGFRPFVYNLAQRLALRGWVRNTSGGVDIEADGDEAALQSLLDALRSEAPPLAQIDEIIISKRSSNGHSSFEIRGSEIQTDGFQPVSPDLSICPDCLAELFDPADRHFRYPFVNCTHCGPRFTIIRDLPYDRPLTSMAGFDMCPGCASEYHDPGNRRYHAQPVSCPKCGPQVWLVQGEKITKDQETALTRVRQLVAEGETVAIKGLGGFHLACDANNPNAVAALRRRKARPDKPLAIMLPDIDTVLRTCEASQAELAELQSARRPIVLLKRRADATIGAEVAPRQRLLGVMLPYTPLHYLLLERADGIPDAWVMTSGNRSEEPILTDNTAAKKQLSPLAVAFLMHNRPIEAGMDDSVVRVEEHTKVVSPIRRARGFAPRPIRLGWASAPLLATGAEQKNTFGLARENYAFVSQHMGDLTNYETLQAYERAIARQERLFRVRPEMIVHDLHPDYLSTRYALERSERQALPALGVQHHHAHVAACMAEHGLPADARVIGFAFDGTGYGSDSAIWGGEVLLAGYRDFQRASHLNYVPMPGGDLAVKETWRLALAWLNLLGLDDGSTLTSAQVNSEKLKGARQQLVSGLNAPLTSSMGRLFDAVAALTGLRTTVNYEGQAAIELENCVEPSVSEAYAFDVCEETFSAEPVLHQVLEDVNNAVNLGRIAARFHNGVADMVLELSENLRSRHGLDTVVLSGGVWQNMTLLAATRTRLEASKFRLFTHQQVPANDGGIALGQLAVAHHNLKA
ncbi:MAG: carbamoyltransferase HypF [Anaerolineales bacterium]